MTGSKRPAPHVSQRAGTDASERLCPAGHSVEFGVLGPFEVRVGGRVVDVGSPKHRVLLAVLVLRAGRRVPVEELAAAIWGEEDQPDNPRRTVQLYVTRLRGLLGPPGPGGEEMISTWPGGYQLRVRPEQTDLGRFRHLVEVAGQAAAAGDLAGEAGALAEALACWRGEPLAGVPSELLAREAAPALSEQRLQVLERRLDADLRRGRHAEVAGELVTLTARHPLREKLWAQLMTALDGSGRRADALSAYHTVRRNLAEELGIDPGPELQALHAAILAGRAPAAHPAPRQLPADVPAFTGRAEELARLDALLGSEPSRAGLAGGAPPMQVCVIAGMAGVGKTALAAHWARRAADHFPDGQLWVNLRGYDRGQAVAPEKALTRFLRALGVPDAEIPLEVDEAASLYRSLMDGRRMLIVLDNASSAEQVRLLLPGAPGCLVVVTSRNQLVGLVATESAHLLVLDLLTLAEARQLLSGRLGAERLQDAGPAVEEIVSLCARLPLALAIAAGRAAANPEFGLHTLATELRGARGSLDAFTGPDPATEVRAVFSWSYRALSAPAARLFRLLGLHPGPDATIATAASLAGIPVAEVRPLLAQLCDSYLVTEHAPGRFTVHDLLRAYATELSDANDDEAEQRRARHRMLDHYLHTAHNAVVMLHPIEDSPTPPPPCPGVTVEDLGGHRQALAWFGTEHHTLVALIRQAAPAGFPLHTWQLTWALTEYLYRRGHWHDWVLAFQTALGAVSQPGHRTEQARAHRGLARAYARLGHPDAAETHCKLALELSSALNDRTELAQTHRVFGIVLETLGRNREALAHDLQALELFRAVGHRLGLARAYNSAGWSYALLGEYQQALAHCEQALTLLRELGDRQGQAATWDSVGYAHHHLGHHEQAITCYQQALALFRDVGDRYKEAETLTHLGDAHGAAGNTEEARTAWWRALDVFTDLGHRDAERMRAKLRKLGLTDTGGAQPAEEA